MTWWGWMILGAVLLGAELTVDAQFYLVFLGVAAALVGVASLFGIAMPEWAQWMLFGALSLLFMVTFRKSVYAKIRGGAKGFNETISGDTVDIIEDLAPGAETRAEYRGTNWTIRNVGDESIPGGSRAIVVKVDGLTLHVSADEQQRG